MASLRAVAESVNAKLNERGLAKATEDGVSVPMHPVVRSAYLLILAQLARATGARHGLDLHPVTNGRGAGTGFRRLLAVDVMPSRGQVVDFDLEVVTVELETIPLEDVLAFKRESAGAHRRYMQNLRAFTFDLSVMEDADRARALADRRADLQDEARDLRERASKAWRSPKAMSGFGLDLRRGVVGGNRQSGPGRAGRAWCWLGDASRQGRGQRVLLPLRGAQAASVSARGPVSRGDGGSTSVGPHM